MFGVSASSDALPEDLAAAHEMIARLTRELAHKDAALATREAENARLAAIIKKLQRSQFGKSSEKVTPDQLNLAFEDLEMALAASEAEAEATTPAHLRKPRTAKSALNCRRICRVSRSSSTSRTKPARAVAACCMSLVKIAPSVWISSRHSTACW